MATIKLNKIFLVYLIPALFMVFSIKAQRTYITNSLLSDGKIAKIAISNEGIYKIDVAFLQQSGVYTTNLPSNTIQLLGNGGFMIPENNAKSRIDDVKSIAIEMNDGGDGIFNGTDYFIFYASGPDQWVADTILQNFNFIKNLYENQSFYFIKIGNVSSYKIQNAIALPVTGPTINTGIDKIILEKDSLNLLKSGKNWYGEIINNLSSFTKSISLQANFKNTPINPIKLFVSGAARSINTSCQLEVKLNNNLVGNVFFNGVSGGFVSTYATESFQNFSPNANQNNLLQLSILGGNSNTLIWHDKTIALANSLLQIPSSGNLIINSWQNLGVNSNASYVVSNAINNAQIWDITKQDAPIKMHTVQTGTNIQFVSNTSFFKTFIAFEPSSIKVPIFIEKISNSNLHSLAPKPYLIITNSELVPSAIRLKNFHVSKHQLESNIVNIKDVFNEFGSGSKDPTALRDFVKMIYDKSFGTTNKLQYLLLLGDATYKYKSSISNYIPSWQSSASLDPISSYVSDDYYGYLDDNEDINANSVLDNIDIAIGRIPARNEVEASQFIDKIENYESFESFGEWRSKCSFIADDEDFNLHLNDAEYLIQNNFTTNPKFTIKKNYLDANKQVLSNGSGTYPTAITKINNAMNNGNVIWNYSGHGTYNRLTEESVIELPTTANWKTKNKWPIMVTATCDFAPFDNPDEFSLGENLLLQKNDGAIALLTTTRLVFANSNKIINNNYLQFQLSQINNNYNTIGRSIQLAKNATINTGDAINARKFICLGDPALTPSFPKHTIKTTSINNLPFTVYADTLKGLERIKIKGSILKNGIVHTNFNGTIKFTIYDKAQISKTLGNDPTSIIVPFNTNESVIYKGNAIINSGNFETDFILPKDVNINIGFGFIKYYAFNDQEDAWGADSILIGGINNEVDIDITPPQIELHVNNLKTINDSKITNPVTLLANIKDASGINLSTSGIGHEITAQIDNNLEKLILNDNFIQTTNVYPEGNLSYFFGNLSLGKHKITLKAWDVFNNSATEIINFEVIEPVKPEIFELRNYPNPFSDNTTIIAGHNLISPILKVQLVILNNLGQVLFQQIKEIPNNTSHYCVFKYNFPDYLSAFKGPLLYTLNIKSALNGEESVTKSGKMIKL